MVDAGILEQVLGSIHNWFTRDEFGVTGCEIVDGSLPASVPFPDGVWYRIQGSYLNDGMHLKGDESEGLVDETFDGTITTHVIPKALLSIVEEITQWTADYGAKANSPYQSESFGGYSYSMRSDGGSGSSNSPRKSGWESAFARRFTQWRKLS
jgi:hypothetical protein